MSPELDIINAALDNNALPKEDNPEKQKEATEYTDIYYDDLVKKIINDP